MAHTLSPELTYLSPSLPEHVSVAASCVEESSKCGVASAAAAAAQDGRVLSAEELAALTGDRLAPVNQFTLNKDEPKRSMAELVQALQEATEAGASKNDLNRLYNIMMSYDASANEWKRFEFWDDKKKYTRNLIACVPDCFTLMLLCWNGEKGSPIHNHSGSECFMRVLVGSITEQQYIVRGGEGDATAKQNWSKIVCSNIAPSDLILTHRNEYNAGGCTFINDSLGVHSVVNPIKGRTVTLHCYIPGYDTCTSWSADATEVDEAKKVKIQQCTISYDTEQGERTHA